ncbi:MAG: glycosyltransferase family 4 protein [Verrucomicrobia bacterium]|jgi:glycosyltransferase involved in cell wall biosynthesis|nr:glycosyltransferase family 4 protein [Verrucomicrobiota bacterium]MDA0905304.1 glycosyltransferase family 4 protein [Verrucomicrobiota bacterium]MDA1077773.1 glycosyltransferase family 4 protein [Verrucomicrobiota bacterium]NDH15855.1 glycosyltransferase [Opitutae bacterium]
MSKNIGFVSTRFAGQDGVSLESAKWAEVLWQDRHVSFWYSGQSDRNPDISHVVPEAFFGFSENQWINERIWKGDVRDRFVTERIRALSDYIKSTLYRFVEKFDIDILVPQNCLAIPMHIPLGIALTEFLSETRMPAIAHHHDFYWERTRFSVNCIPEYLDMSFPPKLSNMRDVVINQEAQEQLALRKGSASLVIPNVFDFENPPEQVDEYASDVRKELGLSEDDFFILQPTRVVPRKGIEQAIKLVSLLKDPRCKLVISHEAGDEGYEYLGMLEQLAKEEGVDMRIVADRVGEVRQRDSEGRKVYTLWDLYHHADFVTYPSTYEGFGNALLEAIYFRKPVLINRYSIFVRDIEPKGFRLLTMDGFVTPTIARQVRQILTDRDLCEEIVNHNYEVARQFYSYSTIRSNLRAFIADLTGY